MQGRSQLMLSLPGNGEDSNDTIYLGSSSTPAATGADATGAYPTDFYHAGFTGGGTLTINGDGLDASPGASFTVNIQADLIDEWDEKIEINLGDSPVNAQKGGTFQHVITITDVSDAPTINFTTIAEGSGTTETASAAATINFTDHIALNRESGVRISIFLITRKVIQARQLLVRTIRLSVVLLRSLRALPLQRLRWHYLFYRMTLMNLMNRQ